MVEFSETTQATLVLAAVANIRTVVGANIVLLK